METKIKKIFKDLCKVNTKFIEAGQKIIPMCFILDKKDKMSMIAMPFENNEQKEKCRLIIMKMIALSDLKAYIFMSDTNMTLMDVKDKNKNTVQEVAIRTLYTKDEVIRDWIIHDYNKIIGKFDVSMFDKPNAKYSDNWNFWGSKIENEDTEKINKAYFEFKKNNKGLYR